MAVTNPYDYKVRDLRTTLFDMAIKLEEMKYAMRAGTAIDADIAPGQTIALIESIKQAEQAIDELRVKLFDVQRA